MGVNFCNNTVESIAPLTYHDNKRHNLRQCASPDGFCFAST